MIKYPNHPWSRHSNFDEIKMRNWWSDLDRLKMSSNKQLFVYSLSSCGQITKTMKEEKAAKLTFASSGDRTSPILCITYVKKNYKFVENKSSTNIAFHQFTSTRSVLVMNPFPSLSKTRKASLTCVLIWIFGWCIFL